MPESAWRNNRGKFYEKHDCRAAAMRQPYVFSEDSDAMKFFVSLQLCLLWIKIFKYEEYTHPFDDLLADLFVCFCVRTVRRAREMGLQDGEGQ
jgi:hypothetical protein